MTAWLVILAVGAGTYLLRASMFVLVGERPLPAWMTAPMALVGSAAIGAPRRLDGSPGHGGAAPSVSPEPGGPSPGPGRGRSGNVPRLPWACWSCGWRPPLVAEPGDGGVGRFDMAPGPDREGGGYGRPRPRRRVADDRAARTGWPTR
ncbi:MAG: AzlD domain-containing protein [Microthrixaceae bacterium]|nr:AzlD domain-containing protein [Microthrixaceae bacterium]